MVISLRRMGHEGRAAVRRAMPMRMYPRTVVGKVPIATVMGTLHGFPGTVPPWGTGGVLRAK
jgi:hypothetical protein